MKKLALVSLMASVYLLAADKPYELGVNLGLTSIKNEPSIKLRNSTIGLNLQLNNYYIKPRFDFEYVDISSKENEIPTSLLKVSANGVYEFAQNSKVYPYILGGLGYESVTDERPGFESHPFVQGGGGLGIGITENIKAKAELKALQILGGDEENNEFIASVGVAMPFGDTAQPVVKREIVDSDGDGVMDRLDKCPNTPAGTRVDGSGCPLPETAPAPVVEVAAPVSFDEKECPIKIDLPDEDRDGVEDSVDQCPGTPCDFSVDSKGCPIKAILRIHFATDSAKITPYSMKKVRKFARFLLDHKGSLVHIVGHTDSRASDAYNMVLSKRRADAVKQALIDLGVSASRLSTEGRGERDPIASNATEQGRALNRRIEVTLTYPQYVEGR
ncbi:MAG: OmpA family protein [Epsilonproteobacteria bacterium]|nr:OmpA family protein [Campylobacterota bacterium]